jgi:outer membrane protein TolC
MDAELIELLRRNGKKGRELRLDLCDAAADLIESQAKEIARLSAIERKIEAIRTALGDEPHE